MQKARAFYYEVAFLTKYVIIKLTKYTSKEKKMKKYIMFLFSIITIISILNPFCLTAINPSKNSSQRTDSDSDSSDDVITLSSDDELSDDVITLSSNDIPLPSSNLQHSKPKFSTDIPNVNDKKVPRSLAALSLEGAKKDKRCKFSKFANCKKLYQKLKMDISKDSAQEISKKYTGSPGNFQRLHLSYNGYLRYDPELALKDDEKLEILSDIVIWGKHFKNSHDISMVYRKTWPKAISNLLYEAGIVEKNWDRKYIIGSGSPENRYFHNSFSQYVNNEYFRDLEQIVNNNIGKIICDKGFLSTTTDINCVPKFGTIDMYIKLNSAKIYKIPQSSQKEIVVSPQQKLKLIGAKHDESSKKFKIYLEAI